MMKYPELNPNENAYPNEQGAFGLTKRELFAAMAMQGLLSNPELSAEFEAYASDSVKFADALIDGLNK